MDCRPSVFVVLLVAASVAGCASAPPRFDFESDMIFPADRSLNRPEDGIALADGRRLVTDRLHGLRMV